MESQNVAVGAIEFKLKQPSLPLIMTALENAQMQVGKGDMACREGLAVELCWMTIGDGLRHEEDDHVETIEI